MVKGSRIHSIFLGITLLLVFSGDLIAEDIRIYDLKGLTRFSSAVKGEVTLIIDFTGPITARRVWLESEDGFNESISAELRAPNSFVVRVQRPGQYKIHTDPPESSIASVRKAK